MTRGSMVKRLAITVALLAAALLTASCKGPTKVDAAWPKATSDRVVPKPAGTPRWPLTGLDAPSLAATQLRVVSVKIENSPAARPQTGLNAADVVYEVIAEGGITRFHAIFQSQVPKVVGPVRSCRPPDLYIVPQYHGIFAHVGGPKAVRTILKGAPALYHDMDEFFNPSSYWRVSNRAAPHNMYLDITKLRKVAVTKRGYAATETITGLEFNKSDRAVEMSSAVSQVTVPMSSYNLVRWKLDAATGLYGRSINGTPHKDAVTGKQLTARNVVVLWTTIRPYPGDKHGVVEIKLKGTGKASLFVAGQRIDCTWEAGGSTPPVLRDANGDPVRLDPGNTWFQVVATGTKIQTK